MSYRLKHGQSEQAVLDEHLRTGQPLPPQFENPPELWTGNEFSFFAWFELHGSRQIGMGAGPIPWESILAYGRYYDVEDIEEFIADVREMDNHYLTWSEQKQKAAAPKKGKFGRGGRS